MHRNCYRERGSAEKRELLKRYGTLFSEELGIGLSKGDRKEVFRWFLASVLFSAPISEDAARKTYLLLRRNGIDTPEAILGTGWDGLVKVLDNGGYTRYDFKTADKLLEMADNLKRLYGSDMNRLHSESGSQADLERRLELAKGIGPTTVSIFLREMKGAWDVEPRHTPVVMAAAKRLRIALGKRFDKRLDAALVRYAHANRGRARKGGARRQLIKS